MERNGCFLFLPSQVDIEPSCPAIDRGYLATPFGTLCSALSQRGSRYFGTFPCTILYVITSAPPFTFRRLVTQGDWLATTFFFYHVRDIPLFIALPLDHCHLEAVPTPPIPVPQLQALHLSRGTCLASSRQPGGGLSKPVAVSSPELRLTNGLPWISDVVALSYSARPSRPHCPVSWAIFAQAPNCTSRPSGPELHSSEPLATPPVRVQSPITRPDPVRVSGVWPCPPIVRWRDAPSDFQLSVVEVPWPRTTNPELTSAGRFFLVYGFKHPPTTRVPALGYAYGSRSLLTPCHGSPVVKTSPLTVHKQHCEPLVLSKSSPFFRLFSMYIP